MIYFVSIFCSCVTSRQRPTIIEEDGYLLVMRQDFYYLPNLNVENLESLNNQQVFPLYLSNHTFYPNSIRDDLKKSSVVVLEKTNLPNGRVVDTLYHGRITIYYKKDKTLQSTSSKSLLKKIEYSKLDSTRFTLFTKDKYLANVYFIVPRGSDINPF